jgi:sugar (pentulose or hexulose) kinase
MVTGEGLVLGFDAGTSSVKAALFDAEGRIAASASEPYPLILCGPGCCEQAPEEWWRAMAAATRRVLAAAAARPERVAAIGIAAQMCGVVPVDRDGAALANALIWMDTRSSAIAEKLIGGIIEIGGYGVLNLARWMRVTGGAPNPSGRDPPSKMLWLRENRPDVWACVHKLLDVKDYLVHRATGRFVTSYDCAHLTWLFDARPGRRQWSHALLTRTGVEAKLFPDIGRATEAAGGLTQGAAAALGLRAGTTVSIGLGDVSASALGAGAARAGAPHLSVGSGSWLGVALPRSRVNPLTGIGTITGADGNDYFLIAAQENAGTCVDWVLPLLGLAAGDYARFEVLAASARAELGAPFFLPWLNGERVPVDERTLRGGFLNLAIEHRPPDMARAVFEGVALNLRWAMADFDRLGGCAGKPLAMVGGGAASGLWCQILADALQRPLEVAEAHALGGARGAAMVAAVTAGWFPDLAAASVMARKARRYDPDAGLAAHYAARFEAFRASCQRLRSWYRRAARAAGARRG